ncbi:MAG: citramalate synthase [Vicinamibacterales bacterium]
MIEIYDTTLRDGTQGEGVTFSVTDKLRVAEKLDAFGVHFIEGGWPGSNPRDIEFFELAKTRTFRTARLAAFGSTRRKDTAVEADDQVRLLIDASTPVVTIFGKTWLLHVLEVLQTTPEENLAMIGDTVRFLKSHGKHVVYDAEHAFDGTKDNREYALATWKAAEAAGADCITLCDTNGGSLPEEIAEIVSFAKRNLNTQIGIHTHDDIGLGVANALAALAVGATHVQGTINGYGERTGNCNITSVMPILQFKLKQPNVAPESFPQLKELSQFLDETANIRPNPRLPWVGSAAFSHKGGAHVNAVQKVLRSYEHIDPALIGNARQCARQRSRGPQQHRDEGARTRLRHHQQHAAATPDADAHQGTRASGLRVRVGRWLAGARHQALADEHAAAVRRRRLQRVGASRRRHVEL